MNAAVLQTGFKQNIFSRIFVLQNYQYICSIYYNNYYYYYACKILLHFWLAWHWFVKF